MHIMSINSLARQLKIEIFYLYYSRNDCSQGTTWHPSRKQMLHCIFIPGGKPVFKLKNSFVSQSLITHRKQKQFCFNLITNFKNNTYMSCTSQVKNPKTILQEETRSKQRPVTMSAQDHRLVVRLLQLYYTIVPSSYYCVSLNILTGQT